MPMRPGSTTVRVLVAALGVLIVILAFSLIASRSSASQDVTYEEYIGYLEVGEVSSVTRNNSTGDITFTLINNPDAEISTTGSPVVFEAELELLSQIPATPDGSGGVTFLTPQQGSTQLVFFSLPIIALLGIVVIIGALIAIAVVNQNQPRPPKT